MSAVSTAGLSGLSKSVVKGAIAGLGGGVVFGVMMAMMGMLPMVAGLVGSDLPVIGAVIHLLIGAVIGAIYGGVISLIGFQLSAAFGIVSGLINGVIWWVLGALILMPLGLGMTEMVLQVGEMQWLSLVGHLTFGVVTGLLFVWLIQRE